MVSLDTVCYQFVLLPQQKLSKKFKVQGIPTLVLVNKEGKLITTDGRTIVMEDERGNDFPWTPKTFPEIIPGKLINKEGEEKEWDSDTAADVIGLYFSAHWVSE